MNILDFIARPLGQFLFFIYNTIAFHNYGFAIIIFTILVKLILMPLTIKQYHSTAKMQTIQPQIQEVQKRYKDDKEKLNQELAKVYQENKVNPAGGCLPLLVQMPILLSLYRVITGPLKFMLNINSQQISQLASKMHGVNKNAGSIQINIINYFSKHKSELSSMNNVLKPNKLLNMNFLGLHLGNKPSYHFADLFGINSANYLPLLIIPILAVVTTFISTKLAMSQTAKRNDNVKNQNSLQNTMMYISPLITLMFSFQLPAGIALYWIVSNTFQIVLQLYISKFVLNNKWLLNMKK